MSGGPAGAPPPRRPGRLLRRFDGLDEILAWALAVLPWSAVLQLLALVVTCRVRAGAWPRPYIPDVDSVALPGQQVLWALTCTLSLPTLLATPVVSLCRKLAGRRSLWPLALLNVAGFVALMWIVRQPIGDWAWD